MSKGRLIAHLITAAIGAIFIMVLSVSMGWVVSSGRAQATATELSSQAVRAQLVPICVHQFGTHADHSSKLTELRALKAWEREKYVTDNGWATMPGSEAPESGIARQCAVRILEQRS